MIKDVITGGLDVIRKEAWPFCRTTSGVRLCWQLKGHKGLTGLNRAREVGALARLTTSQMNRTVTAEPLRGRQSLTKIAPAELDFLRADTLSIE